MKGLEPGPEPTPPESDEKQSEGSFFEFWTFQKKFLEQNEIEKEETDVQVQQPDSDLWAGGRQMLRQYLQEVGFTDTILDARSARLRALLGGAGGDNEGTVLFWNTTSFPWVVIFLKTGLFPKFIRVIGTR